MCTVADAFAAVKVDVVHTAVIRRHRSDHAVRLRVHLVDIMPQIVAHEADTLAQPAHFVAFPVAASGVGDNGDVVRTASDLMQQLVHIARQLVQLFVELSHPASQPAGNDQHHRRAHQQKQKAEKHHRFGVVRDLLFIPVRAEIHAHDRTHFARRVEHGAIGAVELTPGVLIGVFVHRGRALRGDEQRGRHDDLLAVFARVILSRIDGKGKPAIALVAHSIDVFKINVVLKHLERIIAFLKLRRADIVFSNRPEEVAIKHVRGGIGDVQHALVDEDHHERFRPTQQHGAKQNAERQQQRRNHNKRLCCHADSLLLHAPSLRCLSSTVLLQ